MNESNVKREDIVAAYRMFLGREPENDEVVDNRIGAHASLAELGRAFATSREFQDRFKMNDAAMSGREPRLTIQEEIDPASYERLFRYIEAVWSQLGRTQPHWSVLSVDEYKQSDLDANSIEQFYKSGDIIAKMVVNTLARNGLDAGDFRTCLDLGCGLGRVTVHLADHFNEVSGCDISKPHLERARRYTHERGLTNINYWQLQEITDIAHNRSFDLIFSIIVLQHNPPPIIHEMISQICQALSDGGVAIFQVPTYIEDYSFEIRSYEEFPSDYIEMHCVHQKSVIDRCHREGCEILEVLEDSHTGYKAHERSNTFVIRKVAEVINREGMAL